MTLEYNFDGLVGPTHNYAGLSYGNLASMQNAGTQASPRQAALQSLEKMRKLMHLGVSQAVLPPHERPNIALLNALGYKSIEQAYKFDPRLVAAVFSAASMWVANSATVSPSCNTKDGRIHITPANLTYSLHRAQEAAFNQKIFTTIFSDEKLFAVHKPLPSYSDLADEGAANHSNFCSDYDVPGLEMYVYSRSRDSKQYTGRQTKLASNAVACTRFLRNSHLLVQQNPQLIDEGVFHNDVIAVVNKNVMLYHADAYVDWARHRAKIESFFNQDCYFIEISADQLSIADAVRTYLFNSQLVSLPQGGMALVVPMECKGDVVEPVLQSIRSGNNPVNLVEYVECRQSMQNGGGPACLRLRVVLNEDERQGCHQGVFLNEDLYNKLESWINKHYRETLDINDLLDPSLITEVHNALDELTKILQLGDIYPFQCV